LDVSGIGKPPAPDIAVLQPANSDLKDGTNRTFGTVKTGSTGAPKTFTLRNTGKAPLTGIRFSKSGTHAAEFLVDAPTTTRLDPGKSTTFKVRFKPKSKGTRNAVLKINSNDKDENPFDIRLSGQGAAR
ncbi:MAG: choice-of-anchor D domain-containing protein, partial [Akkermansiaceae bacterium]|nr:choice-of-anchor D domain-containing protein [Akkermansiaceae bacterium]